MFQRVLKAAVGVASATSLDSIMHDILVASVELTGARYGALGIWASTSKDEEPRLAQFLTAGMSSDEEKAIGEWPHGRGILSLVSGTVPVVRIEDLREHPVALGVPLHHPVMTSFLGAPIRLHDSTVGSLYLTNKTGARAFSRVDEEIVVTLAAAAGVALENLRLHDEIQELALVRDRERIARDLHDNVIQRIFAIGLSIQALAVSSGDEVLAGRIQGSVDELDNIIQDIRGIIFALYGTANGKPDPLRARILETAKAVGALTGFSPLVHLNGPVDNVTDGETVDSVVAVVRELLSNVLRHAGASSVDLYVRVGANVTVKVVDNGRGPGTGEFERRGRGLTNLAIRAEQLGGTFLLRNILPHGTEAIWEIPRPDDPT